MTLNIALAMISVGLAGFSVGLSVANIIWLRGTRR